MRCYILAGGRSKRFGRDKLLYKIGGITVIERVANTARKVCDEVFLVSKDKKKFSFIDLPVVEDKAGESASIVGLYTALLHLPKGHALILSGDIPLISEKTLKLLVQNRRPPITLAKTKEKIHPLVGVYEKSVLDEVRKIIEEKNYRLSELVRRVGFFAVDIPPELEHELLNLNTPTDLDEILRHCS
ncbi:MAG: molybdenum cofactor guanylyltransferase [Aquificae bacterium]|nr:molybdenum cofactor guanylyltransferase [Aquificota bacterium]